MTMVSYTQIKWKPHEFIRNNLSGVQFGRKKIQREVSRLSKWNKGFFQVIKNVFECFQATDIAITTIIYCSDKF